MRRPLVFRAYALSADVSLWSLYIGLPAPSYFVERESLPPGVPPSRFRSGLEASYMERGLGSYLRMPSEAINVLYRSGSLRLR